MLLYADDLVLLSESDKGLQTSIDVLHSYCNKWKLQINIMKTNVVIFNKREFKGNFRCGGEILKIVNQVNYLGIIVTSSGSFKATQIFLHSKALKVYMAIRGSLGYTVPPQVMMKLFDTMVLPILCYGAEIWGSYIYRANKTSLIKAVIKNTYSY